MNIKVLHIVGGPLKYGASKGASILHKALIKLNIQSVLLNDSPNNLDQKFLKKKKILFLNNNIIKKIRIKIYIFLEKFIKSLNYKRSNNTFSTGLFGFDITKTKEYQDADIIHLHWLNQGFLKLKCLLKINKPIIWTMRDMWVFTGGCHYSGNCLKYITTCGQCPILKTTNKFDLSYKIQKNKKIIYDKKIKFVAVSDWLKNKAKESNLLKNFDIIKIDNNIDLSELTNFKKNAAKTSLNINTKKQIILYGAQNPQDKRKGWDIFLKSIRYLDKSKYFLLIFGNFWSTEEIKKTGIEFKSLGYLDNKEKLSKVYSCSDIFVASSIQDAWPKTFAEAMYCFTPVVCFSNTSISEVVDHKINGYIADDFSPKKLSEGMTWLLNNIKKDKTIALKANLKIKKYDSLNIANKYINLYKQMIKTYE